MPSSHHTKRPTHNSKRQRKAAENLAKGMSQTQALIEAGYSESYAAALGFRAVKRPCIQSILTHLVEKVMARRKMPMEKLIIPYLDALDAPMIVKSTTEGIATIARDPESQEIIPDHDIRMKAADRLTDFYGGRPRGSDDLTGKELTRGLVVIIQRDGPPRDKPPIDVTPKNIHPTGQAKAKLPARIERA